MLSDIANEVDRLNDILLKSSTIFLFNESRLLPVVSLISCYLSLLLLIRG